MRATNCTWWNHNTTLRISWVVSVKALQRIRRSSYRSPQHFDEHFLCLPARPFPSAGFVGEYCTGCQGNKSEKNYDVVGRTWAVTTMLIMMMSYVALLRDGTLSSDGTTEIQSSVPQALIVLGILILFLLLAGTVFWRVRRTSRTPEK